MKNLVLGDSRTVSRKAAELAGALLLERRLPKGAILEAYLDHVYLGHGAFGAPPPPQAAAAPGAAGASGSSGAAVGLPRLRACVREFCRLAGCGMRWP